MKRLRPYRPDILIIATFLILPLLLYGNVTLGSQTMLPADNLYQWAPWSSAAAELGVGPPHNGLISDLILQNHVWKQYVRETLFAGDIPLWNPHLFAGLPFLAAGQHSAYYPFNLFFLILPLAKAYGWYTLSQVWLAGVLMYGYGRLLNLKRGSALIAGLTFQGCGTLIISAAVFPMVIGAMIWLPLLLGCIEKIIGNSQLTIDDFHRNDSILSRLKYSIFFWVVLGALALGFQIFAGHIEYTIYTLLVMALYAAWRLGAEIRNHYSKSSQQSSINQTDPQIFNQKPFITLIQPFAALSAMVLLGLMLGGVQLVPLYELGQVNFRQASASFEEVRGYAFQERRIITLALPNFFGNPTHHHYRDQFTNETVPFERNYEGQPKQDSTWGFKNYVEGAIYLGILPLVLAGIAVVTQWRNGRIQFFALISMASLAFIFGTPLYGLLFYGLPFVNQLHTPFRWVFPLSVCVAVLAGFGAERVRDQRSGKKLLRGSAVGLVFIGVGLLLGLGIVLWQYGRFAALIERLFLGLALATTAFPSAQAFFSYQFWQVMILGGMIVGSGAVLWLATRQNSRPFLTAATLLIIMDLLIAHWGFHTAVDPELLEYKPDLVRWLEAQPGHWRLTSFNPNGDTSLIPNVGWQYGFEDIRGYDSIIPKQYTDYMAAIEPQGQLIFNKVQPVQSLEALNSPLLDVLNVKYVLTPVAIDLPKYALAWEGSGLRIYENLGAAPRAYTLPLVATAVVADPLAAMQEFDPRQVAIVASTEWPNNPVFQLPVTHSPMNAELIPARISAFSNREVMVETAVSQPSWLILNDSYFPGWNAFVRPVGGSESDEMQVEITRVNGNFRGVLLEPGEWLVRFRYSPASFWLGGLTTVMGGILIIFGGLVWGWQQISQGAGEQNLIQRLAKNSVAPMFLNLFNKSIDFAFAMYYLRVMGPADAGSFQTAITTAILFEIISNFGLDILLIRDVSQAQEKSAHYLLNTTILRLGMAVLAAVPILLFVFTTQRLGNSSFTPNEVVAILLIMSGMIFSGMSKGVTGLFYVYEQADIPATMTTVTTIIKVALGVVALLLGYSFVGLAAVSIIVNIITLSLLITIAVRRFDLSGKWQLDWPLQRSMLHKGWPLMLIHLLQTVFISIDVLLLKLMLPSNGQTVVGWYSSAYKWFNALQVIPSFFTLALFPVISREIQKSMESARHMYQMSLKLMLLLALPISAITFYLAYPLTRLLSGTEFLPHGAIALQLVILSIPFGWLNSVTNYVLIGLGLEQLQPRAFSIAVGFNIVTNLIFIPFFTYQAAAVTTILSEIVLLVLFAYFLRQKMGGVEWGGLLIRPFFLTGLMFGGLYLGGQLHMLVGLLIGLAIFVLGLFWLNIFGDEERTVLINILPDRVAQIWQ